MIRKLAVSLTKNLVFATIGLASSPFASLAPLETEIVPLRLKKGDSVSIRIESSKTLHKSNPLVGGIGMTSLSRWCDGLIPFSMETGEYTLPPALETAFIDMELPTTRFYAIAQEEPFDNLNDALDAYPHLDRKSDFVSDLPVERKSGELSFVLPAHSIVFIEISSARQGPWTGAAVYPKIHHGF